MATMNDVAKKAGVSRGTVSNVINGIKVRPESQRKVEEAIRELGYVPNAYARGLKMNRTQTVVFILPTVWNPFFSKLTHEIEARLREKGYRMLLCQSHNREDIEKDYVEMARQNKADGILSITFSNIWPDLKNSDIPLVTIERYFADDIPFISTDNFLGGKIAAQKLRELGCRKVLFVGRKSMENTIWKIRRDGFLKGCEQVGLEGEAILLESTSEQFPDQLRQLLQEKYDGDIPWDGIFTSVDRYAEYAQDALRSRGVQVPEQVQIIGFDGIPSQANDRIRISSIAQPVEELAQHAVDMLVDQIEGKSYIKAQLMEPFFVSGDTTK